MASEQLKKVIDVVRSQQASGTSEPTIEQLRTGMEKVAERVRMQRPHTDRFLLRDARREKSLLPGIPPAAVSRSRHCSRCVMHRRRYQRALCPSLHGPT
jgi:hypothetical protein